MFFDAVGIIFDLKISPGGVFEKTFENKPGGGLFSGGLIFEKTR